MRYAATNEKRIAQLHPTVARKARQLLEQCEDEGIDVLVNQGLRTIAEQDALYAQGRTKPGSIVTNARGGYSYHNYGLALDFNLVDAQGGAVWTVNAAWRRVAAIGKALGFEWGGDWTGSLIDYPHLQYTFGLSITQLLQGQRPPADTQADIPAANTGGEARMEVVKERIYAKNGKLVRCDGDYKQTASDVRYIKFPAGSVQLKFVARKGAKVSQLLAETGADFATNGPFFWLGQVLGNTVADGQVISSPYGNMLKWHEFGAKGGRYQIGHLAGTDWDVLVSASPLLIENGNLCWDYYRNLEETADDIARSNAQRTVYGIDKDGALHIAVADGRTKWDKGPSLEEMALYMASKGCTYALNLDGGGSSVIAQKGRGSLGQNQGAAEASVNHAILIFAKTTEQPKPTPAPDEQPKTTPAPDDWKQIGADWLLANGYVTQPHDKTEAVDVGLLGAILKNKAEGGK